MDLETVVEMALPRTRGELPRHEEGDAFLAGGTWVFSAPQTGVRRLVDLTTLGWRALTATPAGLEIAATCTLGELVAFADGDPRARVASGEGDPESSVGGARDTDGGPRDSGEDRRDRVDEALTHWPALALLRPCCDALRGSFKVQHAATVGGNVCLALPAAPMVALAAALDGDCLVWTPGGGERHVPTEAFVLGERLTVLRSGELLRSVVLPATALRARTAIRQASLAPLGRSAALLIARVDEDGAFVLTITASTPAPVVVRLSAVPGPHELATALADTLAPTGFHDDVHGAPAWRAHLTGLLAEELRTELADTVS